MRCFEVCETSKLPEKGFNCCGAKPRLRRADSRFAEPRCSLQRGRFYVLFASCKKNQKARQRFANLWTPGTIQIAGRYVVVVKVTGFHQVTGYAENCIFPGIAGNDLNRCEVPALQHKEFTQTAKERLYSLQTVGKGWCEWEMEGGKELFWVGIRKSLGKSTAFVL